MVQRRRIKLRPLAVGERTELERVARAGSERADRVARATALLAVADGATFTACRCSGLLRGQHSWWPK